MAKVDSAEILAELGQGVGLFDGQSPLLVVVALAGMSLLPFAVLAFTSFLKVSVVFAILRNALSANQLPSAAVTSMISLVLTVFIMKPVLGECYQRFQESYLSIQSENKKKPVDKSSETTAVVERFLTAFSSGVQPLEDFLRKHSKDRERVFFVKLRQSSGRAASTASEDKIRCEKPQGTDSGARCVLSGEDLTTLVPAFVISELKEAFALGFTVFLPFLVLDIVVANVLVGMGMMMVSPVTISLPLKLALFVMSDAWFLLCRSLVLGYQ